MRVLLRHASAWLRSIFYEKTLEKVSLRRHVCYDIKVCLDRHIRKQVSVNIIFIGDIVGNAAIKAVSSELPGLKQKYKCDFVIANGENVAGGLGLTAQAATQLYAAGVQVITLGNHTWSKPDLLKTIDQDAKILRPANGLAEWPGKGYAIYPIGGRKLAVINLLGQVYMSPVQSPFAEVERIVKLLKKENVKHILIDMHAEASAEKMALAYSLAGRVSAVCGTHTHVQTADERILKDFTGYITDAGMTGPYDSIIGMQVESSLRRLAQQLPARYLLAEGPISLQAVAITLEDESGRCLAIERINLKAKIY